MRLHVLALLCIRILTLPAQAQWDLQDSHATASLRGIHNVGGGVAWASGTNGTVLRTEDGGYLWQTCAVPPGAEKLDFRGIQAFDENAAIVMSSGKGDLSRLYKTTDGCKSWKLVFTNPDKDGFWDTLLMTDKNIGMLIGDPIPISSSGTNNASPHWVFPTYHTIDNGLTWRRNDHDRLPATANEKGEPEESIYAASNSSMLVLPYLTVFVTGGLQSALHFEQYTFDPVPNFCTGGSMCSVVADTPSGLAEGNTAGGFSVAANWVLGSYSPHSELHARTLSSDTHAVVIVGGDYKLAEEQQGTASVCRPLRQGSFAAFECEPAQTQPHGYRSAVAYDEKTKTWITVGPNGTDISTDDGKNWRALKPKPGQPADADKNWSALSLPFVVGPNGRIAKLRNDALKP